MLGRTWGPIAATLASLSLGPLQTGCRGQGPQEVHPAGRSGCPSFVEVSGGLPISPGWRTNPALGDVDGDGYLDLAATSRKGEGPKVFNFLPTGRWRDSSRGLTLDLYPCGIGVDLVDVTADGLADLLVADHCTGLYVFRGDGQGGWTRLVRLQHPSGEGFNDAAAGDLDGDGRMDLVALGAFTTGFTLFFQNERGGFEARETNLPASGFGYRVRLADLNGDGRLDLYSTLQGIPPDRRARGGREAKVWLQSGAGRWEPAGGLPEEGAFYGIALGDIDANNHPDFALSSMDYEGGLRIYRGNGAGTWRPSPAPSPGLGPGRSFAGVTLVDLDLDGNLDLVAVEHRRPAVVVWIGDGTGQLTECPPVHPPLPASLGPGWGLTVGDIDRDGLPDVVAGFGNEGGGALRAWWVRIAPH